MAREVLYPYQTRDQDLDLDQSQDQNHNFNSDPIGVRVVLNLKRTALLSQADLVDLGLLHSHHLLMVTNKTEVGMTTTTTKADEKVEKVEKVTESR